MPHRTDFSQLDQVANPVFVLEVAPDGRPLYVAFNAFALAATGRPLSDYVGKTALEVYGNGFGEVVYAHHCDVIKNGAPETYEVELPFVDGPRLVRTTLKPTKDAAGRVTLIYGSSVDLSSERKAQVAQASLDTLTGDIGQFVSMAAHDLRAPMRNVGLLADMLREGFVDHGDGKMELIDMLEDMAGRSLVLISDVLSHSIATSAEAEPTCFQFDVLCQDIIAVLDPLKNHHLSAPDVSVCADRAALQIVIRNLIENALKHGRRDSLNITAALRANGPDQIEVGISDDGLGFENPGLQFLDKGDFRVESGYGLLGIRRLIDARGGTIRVCGTKDSGCNVTFTLPGKLMQNSTAVTAAC